MKKISNEKIKNEIDLEQKKELSECTFKPKINEINIKCFKNTDIKNNKIFNKKEKVKDVQNIIENQNQKIKNEIVKDKEIKNNNISNKKDKKRKNIVRNQTPIYERLYNYHSRKKEEEKNSKEMEILFKPQINYNYKKDFNKKPFNERQKIYSAKSTERRKNLENQIYTKYDSKTGQKLFHPSINKNKHFYKIQNNKYYSRSMNKQKIKDKNGNMKKEILTKIKMQTSFKANIKSDNIYENIIINSFKKIFKILDVNLKGKIYLFNYNTKNLPINIKNPKTRKNISNESTITITKTNEKFEITLNLIDLIEVTESIDNNSPIIVLNGNYVEYINVNSNETEINNNLIQNGAKAYSSTGEELTEITTQIKIGETEKTSIKTNTLDTYEITYTVTYNGKTTSATRTVIIRDTESPTITLPKETILLANQVNGYDLRQDVSVTDNYDSNSTLTINSGLSNRPGKYVVTYTATDGSGNQTTERRVIIVENTPTYIIKGKTTPSNNNTPTMENPVTYYGFGRDNYIDVIVTDGNNQFNESDYSKLDNYPDTYGNYKSAKIQLKPNTTYKVNIKRYNNFDGKNNGYLLMSNIPQINGYAWTSISHESRPNEALTNYVYTTTSDGLLYIGYFYQMTQEKLNTIWSNTDVAIEEVTTSTRIDLTGHDPLMCSNDICDYIDYENSRIVRYIKKYTFTGNESFGGLNSPSWIANNTETTKVLYYRNDSI